MQRSQSGLTLVELLVVMAILGLIVGLVGPQAMKQFAGAKTDAARLQISDLSAALDLFYLDVGRYPTTSEGLGALVQRPAGVDDWDGPYLRSARAPVDSWGNAYIYKSPGDHGPFDIYSFGPNPAAGGGTEAAAVASWD